MKYTLLVVLICCALLLFTACDKEKPVSTDQNSDPTTSTDAGEVEIKKYYEVLRPEKINPSLGFAQFLSDVNWNGEYLPHTEIIPPGGLRDPSLIPPAPQDLVGQTVEVAFHHDSSPIYFYYHANEELQQERLAVIMDARIPLLVILETNLGGADQLRDKLATADSFQVKVLALANMDNLEPMYISNTHRASLEEHTNLSSEFVDIFGNAPTYGMFIGKVEHYTSQNNIAYLRGCAPSSVSEELEECLAVYEIRFARYCFMDEMLLATN